MGEGRGEGRSGGDIFLLSEVRVDVIAIVYANCKGENCCRCSAKLTFESA